MEEVRASESHEGVSYCHLRETDSALHEVVSSSRGQVRFLGETGEPLESPERIAAALCSRPESWLEPELYVALLHRCRTSP